jgi:PAS domain S-box-containing protein
VAAAAHARAGSASLLAAIGQAAERIIGSDLSDDTLDAALGIIGRAAEVSRVRIFRLPEPGVSLRTAPVHEWCAAGVAPTKERTDLKTDALDGAFARWADLLARGEVIKGNARDFPAGERESMERQEVRSLAVVPVFTSQGLSGFIGFDDCVRERAWPEDLVNTLGIVARVLGASYDRAESCRRQRAMQAHYHALLDNLNEGVFKTDPRGRFTYLNAAWRTLTGCSPAEGLGMFCGLAVCMSDRLALRAALVRLLRGEVPWQRCEARLLRTDGTTRWVQISVRRLESPAEDAGGLAGTLVDISANKHAEAQLTAAKHDAEAASRAKTEFLSTISHELRTPLNTIIGLSDSLLEPTTGADPARAQQFLTLIRASGMLLDHQIGSILELARLEAGQIVLNAGPLDVGLLCARICAGTRPELAEKKLQLELCPPTDAAVIEADDRLLTSALQHLVVNAIKFTPPGGRIVIRAEVKAGIGATISVTDTGVGIAPEKRHLLFQPFTQLDSSLGRRFGGSGLGLVLADKFIRLHGGSIEVVSKLSRGSTFTIILPAVPPDFTPPAARSSAGTPSFS